MMASPETPLSKLIKGHVTCTVCGAAYGKCDCWTRCSCGWSYRKGGTCGNPEHGGDDGPMEITHAVSEESQMTAPAPAQRAPDAHLAASGGGKGWYPFWSSLADAEADTVADALEEWADQETGITSNGKALLYTAARLLRTAKADIKADMLPPSGEEQKEDEDDTTRQRPLLEPEGKEQVLADDASAVLAAEDETCKHGRPLHQDCFICDEASPSPQESDIDGLIERLKAAYAEKYKHEGADVIAIDPELIQEAIDELMSIRVDFNQLYDRWNEQSAALDGMRRKRDKLCAALEEAYVREEHDVKALAAAEKLNAELLQKLKEAIALFDSCAACSEVYFDSWGEQRNSLVAYVEEAKP